MWEAMYQPFGEDGGMKATPPWSTLISSMLTAIRTVHVYEVERLISESDRNGRKEKAGCPDKNVFIICTGLQRSRLQGMAYHIYCIVDHTVLRRPAQAYVHALTHLVCVRRQEPHPVY